MDDYVMYWLYCRMLWDLILPPRVVVNVSHGKVSIRSNTQVFFLASFCRNCMLNQQRAVYDRRTHLIPEEKMPYIAGLMLVNCLQRLATLNLQRVNNVFCLSYFYLAHKMFWDSVVGLVCVCVGGGGAVFPHICQRKVISSKHKTFV